jgi:hypothetical protein
MKEWESSPMPRRSRLLLLVQSTSPDRPGTPAPNRCFGSSWELIGRLTSERVLRSYLPRVRTQPIRHPPVIAIPTTAMIFADETSTVAIPTNVRIAATSATSGKRETRIMAKGRGTTATLSARPYECASHHRTPLTRIVQSGRYTGRPCSAMTLANSLQSR